METNKKLNFKLQNKINNYNKYIKLLFKMNKHPTANKEEVYVLSNLLNNSGCMRCIKATECRITEKHGCSFHTNLSRFIQNPTYINGMEQAIKRSKLDFDGKFPFYTVCNYVNGRCRNCEEGRTKNILYNNQQITICYPLLNTIRNKVTIGMHIDVKLIMRGIKYEISALPYVLKPRPVKIQDELIIKKNTTEFNEENWPELDNKQVEKSESVLDFSKITKQNNMANEGASNEGASNEGASNEGASNEGASNKGASNEGASNEGASNKGASNEGASNEGASNKGASNKGASNKGATEQKLTHLLDYENQINELIFEISFLKKKSQSFDELSIDNSLLRKEIKNLKKEIIELKNRNIDKHSYNEILENISTINNRVSDQFLKTNYSDYIFVN